MIFFNRDQFQLKPLKVHVYKIKMSQSNHQALINDAEVLTIVKNASHAEIASIVSWTLKQKDGEMTGFLGGYWKLNIEAILVSI